LGNDHEVEFHEIKIQLFQKVEFLIMRSKFNLFMRSNLSNNIDQEVDTLIMRSKFPNNAFFNFDLMINLLAASVIMKSNVFMRRWLIIGAKNLPQVQLTKF
jgi:hypothetical protein